MKRPVASTKTLSLAALAFFIVAVALLGVSYLNQSPGRSGKTISITIPAGANVVPHGFNVTDLLNGRYHYPWNTTVVLGVNNTISWDNADDEAHTVSSFIVPSGAAAFNSNLIAPGQTFSVKLNVPGSYKYTCMWHPWLAGEIVVKSP